MSLDTLHFLDGQLYDCVQCGKGCNSQSDWRVLVDPRAVRSVRGSLVELRVIEEHGAAWDVDGGAVTTAIRSDGCCAFLREDQLCGIHAELGVEAKPIVCRLYPFEVSPTPDGIFVSASFRCTAVQRNVGRPMSAHSADIQALMARAEFRQMGFEPVAVSQNTTIDWPGYKALEAFLVKRLGEVAPEVGFGEALWAICEEVATGPPLLDASVTSAALKRQRSGRMEADAGVISLLSEVMMTSLSHVERLHHPPMLKAASEGRPFPLPAAHWWGTLPDLELAVTDRVGARYDAAIARYLNALLFGKRLIMFFKGTVLENLASMYLLPATLRIYTAAFAAANHRNAEDEDFFKALDLVELRLTTHARDIPHYVGPLTLQVAALVAQA